MRLATSLNVIDLALPREAAVRRCAAAGFEAVDFNYWDFHARLLTHAWPEEEVWLHGVRSAADEAGVVILQTHGPVFDIYAAGSAPDTALDLSTRALRAAALLGAPWVVFHPATPPSDVPWAEAERRNHTFFRALIETAERTGVGIAIENMNDRSAGRRSNQSDAAPATARRRYGSTLDELLLLVDLLDHPLVGVCWDTGHAHVQGLDQTAALRQVGRRLKATHIHDNDGLSDQHLLPLQGTIEWSRTIGALREIGYTGAFAYETHASFRALPDTLRDAALTYAHALGRHLLAQA